MGKSTAGLCRHQKKQTLRSKDAPTVPSSPIEEVLAEIWSQVLGVERIGADDDFFALGGHSLLATQVASRIRDAFRVELPLRSLFEAPTVAGLAREIASARQEETSSQAPPLLPARRDQDLLLSLRVEQRLWFMDRLEPGNALYTTWQAMRLLGNLELRALEEAFAAVVKRHESLRTRLVPSVAGRAGHRADLRYHSRSTICGRPEAAEGGVARRVDQERAGRSISRGSADPGGSAATFPARSRPDRDDAPRHQRRLARGLLIRELASFYAEFRAAGAPTCDRCQCSCRLCRVATRSDAREALDYQVAYWSSRWPDAAGAAGGPPSSVGEELRGAHQSSVRAI